MLFKVVKTTQIENNLAIPQVLKNGQQEKEWKQKVIWKNLKLLGCNAVRHIPYSIQIYWFRPSLMQKSIPQSMTILTSQDSKCYLILEINIYNILDIQVL